MSGQPMPSEGELTALRNRPYRFRTESRYKCPLAAIAYLRLEGENTDRQELIWLANLSLHGLAFFSKSALEAGTTLLLHIPALSEQRKEILARVAHATQQINSDYLIGCRLDGPLSPDELEECLTFDMTPWSPVASRGET